jgi:hypothetical protein
VTPAVAAFTPEVTDQDEAEAETAPRTTLSLPLPSSADDDVDKDGVGGVGTSGSLPVYVLTGTCNFKHGFSSVIDYNLNFSLIQWKLACVCIDWHL